MKSEAWEDLGTRERLTASELKKKRNKLLLEALKPFCESYEENETQVKLRVNGKMYEFWPASDCWQDHSEKKYGTGIEWLLRVIQNGGKNDEKDSRT